MKKILFLAVASVVTCNLFAQKAVSGHISMLPAAVGAKPTATGDTRTLSNIAASDTVRVLYSVAAPGAGYTAGTNSYNDKGFAERFDLTVLDSSVNVIGVLAQFGGTKNAASAKSVTLKIWAQGGPSMIASRLYYVGFPSIVLDSLVVPVTQLGIGAVKDTLKQFMFPSPSGLINGAFFAGYTMNYDYSALAGDTIGLTSSTDGHRTAPDYTVNSISDTLINVQNATLWSDNLWRDNYTQNDSLYNNLAIFPIVTMGFRVGVKGVTRNQLTLFGAYPNPATADFSNVRFSLAEATDVSISLTDMSGRVVSYERAIRLTGGEHTVPVSTAGLPAGEYVYLVRTSVGDGIAGKLVVAGR